MSDTLDNQDDTPLDDKLDAQRDIIRQALNEIANDVGMMLRDVGLTFPVYITVRNSRNSLATIATPVDPSDTEWSSVSHRPQCYRQKNRQHSLRGRMLLCPVVNSRPTSAAEVTAKYDAV